MQLQPNQNHIHALSPGKPYKKPIVYKIMSSSFTP